VWCRLTGERRWFILAAVVKSQGLNEGDVIILTLRRKPVSDPSDPASSLPVERRVFGYVKQTQRYGMRNNEQLHPLIRKSTCPVLSTYIIKLEGARESAYFHQLSSDKIPI